MREVVQKKMRASKKCALTSVGIWHLLPLGQKVHPRAQGSSCMKFASLLRATAVGALALFAAGTTFPGAANANLVLVGGNPPVPVATLGRKLH